MLAPLPEGQNGAHVSPRSHLASAAFERMTWLLTPSGEVRSMLQILRRRAVMRRTGRTGSPETKRAAGAAPKPFIQRSADVPLSGTAARGPFIGRFQKLQRYSPCI